MLVNIIIIIIRIDYNIIGIIIIIRYTKKVRYIISSRECAKKEEPVRKSSSFFLKKAKEADRKENDIVAQLFNLDRHYASVLLNPTYIIQFTVLH